MTRRGRQGRRHRRDHDRRRPGELTRAAADRSGAATPARKPTPGATRPTRRRSATCSSASAARTSARRPSASWSTATTSSSTTSGPGAPTTATGVGWTVNTADTGRRRQRRQRHGHRPVRRALPEAQRDLERRERQDDLLPERDAVRPAEPGGLAAATACSAMPPTRWRTRCKKHEVWGARQLHLLQRRPDDPRDPRLRGAR